MDVLDRLVPGDQTQPLPHIGRQRIADRAGTSQGVVDAATKVPGGYSFGTGMNRNDPGGHQTLRGGVEHIDGGALHLQLAPKTIDLAGQDDFGPDGQLPFSERLVEPGNGEQRGAVVDHRLGNGQVPPGPASAHPFDGDDQRDLFTRLDLVDRNGPGSIDIAARAVQQQVGNRLDPGLLQRRGPAPLEVLDLLDLEPGQLGEGSAAHSTDTR